MPLLYATIGCLVLFITLNYLCKRTSVRPGLCLVFMILGMTSCTTIGRHELLQVDGVTWGSLLWVTGISMLYQLVHLSRHDES